MAEEGERGSGVKGLTTEQRLWRLSTIQGECWVWHGFVSETGYGRINMQHPRRLAYTHRVAYEALVGPIPEGLTLDHLCRNRACWRPEHLEPVTMQVNTLRGVGLPAKRAQQTHCRLGHPLAGENLYAYKGHRYCRQCQRDRRRAWGNRRSPRQITT